MTRATNRIAFTAPAGYNPAQYALLKRYIQSNPSMNLKGVLGINRVPNGKGDTNSNGPVSLNDLGGNLDYPNASPQRRATIAQAHLRWAQGLTPGVQFGGNFGNGGGTDVG